MGTCSCFWIMRGNNLQNKMKDNNIRVSNMNGYADKMDQAYDAFKNKQDNNNQKSKLKQFKQQQNDYSIFSYFRWITDCDEIVKQVIMNNNKKYQRQQQQEQDKQEQFVERNIKNTQQLQILLQKLNQYLQQLDQFLTMQYIETLKLLTPFTKINSFNYSIPLLQQFIVQVDKSQVQQSKKTSTQSNKKGLMKRLIRDAFTVIYINGKINKENNQFTQKLLQYINKVDLSTISKQHSIKGRQSQNENMIDKNSSLIKSLEYIQTQSSDKKEIERGDRLSFLLKMRVGLMIDRRLLSNPLHANKDEVSTGITSLTIKLIQLTYNSARKKQQHQLHIITFPIAFKINNKSNSFADQYQHQENSLDLQFAIVPGMVIVFQTSPLQYICSLSVEQFLAKLYVVDQEFVLVRKQGIQQQSGNTNDNHKNRDSNDNRNKNSLKQNLLSFQPKKYNQLQYSQYPPRLSLTLQTIPMNIVEYLERLKLSTKSMYGNMQAISTNSSLPLEIRSSFASKTSYEESFRFSRSTNSHKNQSQCGC